MSKHKMTKACEISSKTRLKVGNRDGWCCIICGNPSARPEAHYIRRSQGGLGIEQNVVTLCRRCHYDFDNSDKRDEIGDMIRNYLKSCYKNWDEKKLVYNKYQWLDDVKDRADEEG